jgi:hypothetical protein
MMTGYDRNLIISSCHSLRGLRKPNKQEFNSRPQVERKDKLPSSTEKKKKGPAQTESKNKTEPLWLAMKAAQKAQKLFLRKNGFDKKNRFDFSMDPPPLEVSNYKKAREDWFARQREIKLAETSNPGSNLESEKSENQD